jgi:hypothetical protein
MTRKKQVLDVQLTLNEEVKNRFLEIKRANGLVDDADVLKLIIDKYFEKRLMGGCREV